jgi:hypothetical protein
MLAIVSLFALAAAAGWFAHHADRVHYRLSSTRAIAAAREAPSDRAFLAQHPTTSARVIPLDDKLQRVTFFDGPRVVLDAAVNQNGQVVANELHVPGVPASGAVLANSLWILALLNVLFLAVTMVVPLIRVRNLDALVLASFTSTVLLVNARLVDASVICGSLALCYLMLRCAWIGLRSANEHAPVSATPLFTWLTSRWEPHRRRRLLRLIAAASTLAFLMVTLTSSGYSDVATASLTGATDLLHGVLPYGHVSTALHGDTYPLLNYVLYLPAAWWKPVTEAFSDQTGALFVTALGALAAGAAVYRLAGSRDHATRVAPETSEHNLRMLIAWFAFAPVLLAASGGSNDVVLAALVAWMLAARRRPAVSLLLLMMAVWVKLVPLILMPLWLASRSRLRIVTLVPAAILSLALIGLLIALGGVHALAGMVSAMAFQFQRGSFFAPWYTFHLGWLQPLVQAFVVCLLVVSCLHLWRERTSNDGSVRCAALAGTLLLGVQLAANYWTWSYLNGPIAPRGPLACHGPEQESALIVTARRRQPTPVSTASAAHNS